MKFAAFVLLSLVGSIWLAFAMITIAHGPDAVTLGCDFAMFWGASQVAALGHNPFSPAALYHLEHAALGAQEIHTIANRSVVRVGNPPLFFWLLGPFTRIPFRVALDLWQALLTLCVFVGVGVCSATAGNRGRWPVIALTCSCPPVLLVVIFGNVVPFLFLALAVAWRVADRSPYAVGLLATLGWLKPSLSLPLFALIVLFQVSDRARAAGAFVAGSAAAGALSLLLLGSKSFVWWESGLRSYAHDMAAQRMMESLSGLYVRTVSGTVQSTMELAVVAIAAAITLAAWRARATDTLPLDNVAWLWIVWFLATPYAHFVDMLLLAVPVLAVYFARRATSRLVASIYCLYLSWLLLAAAPGGMQLLPIPTIAAAVLLSPIRSAALRIRVRPPMSEPTAVA